MFELSTHWQFWALLAAIFAAATAILAKVGVEEINPDVATLVRTAVVLVVLGAILFATGQLSGGQVWSRKSIVFLILSGLATGASWLCYFRALKLGNASQVAPLDKLSVVLVALFAAIFLGEKHSPFGWVGILLMTAGALLVSLR